MADPIQIITPPSLTSYLALSGTKTPTADVLQFLVDLTNGLVIEAWSKPAAPVPAWVTAIALEVAARPCRNPKGLASWTRSVDDASRTERLPDTAAQAGIFLADLERTRLEGTSRRRRQRYGTVRVRQGF